MQNKNRETQIEMLGNLRALLYAEDHNGRVVGLDLLCGWVAMLDRLTDGQLAAIAQQDKPLLMNNLRGWLKEELLHSRDASAWYEPTLWWGGVI